MDEETHDPEWNIENHPARATLNRFPHGFGAWVHWLEELLWLCHAGVPFDKDDLTILEWKGLAILKKWNEEISQAVKDKS